MSQKLDASPAVIGIDIGATRTDALSPRMLRILEDLMTDWRRLDTRIEDLSGEIEALARQDKGCERPIPGGSVRQGETPEVSVRRELAEEIGLVANAPLQLVGRSVACGTSKS
jgi:hypothetical protein